MYKIIMCNRYSWRPS